MAEYKFLIDWTPSLINFPQTKNKTETTEAELTKIQFKVNTCVEDLAKMDQFAKVVWALPLAMLFIFSITLIESRIFL